MKLETEICEVKKRTFSNITLTISMFSGKDQGVNVRHKCTDMIDFIQDDDRLREERKKAKKNKDKYVGMSSDSMGSRSRGFGGFGGFDSGGSRYDFKSKFMVTNI